MLNELLLAHLEGEKGDGHFFVERGVLGNVEDEGGLSHRRAAGDDDQIGRLETCGDLVQILESAADAGNRFPAALEHLNPLHRRPEELLDSSEAFIPASLVYLEDLVFGGVEQLSGGCSGLECFGDDRCRHFYQATAQCLFADDLGVVLDIGGSRNSVNEKADVIAAAASLEVAGARQLFGERQRINYISTLGKGDHRAEDPTIPFAVEHRVVNELGRPENRIRVHEHRRQHCLLRIFRVRRAPLGVGITLGWRYRELYGRA